GLITMDADKKPNLAPGPTWSAELDAVWNLKVRESRFSPRRDRFPKAEGHLTADFRPRTCAAYSPVILTSARFRRRRSNSPEKICCHGRTPGTPRVPGVASKHLKFASRKTES